MVFDRKTNYFGRNLNQTLEPRLYYLYVPYRNQTNLPLFDTGAGRCQLCPDVQREHLYRIGTGILNANQVTAAMSARVIRWKRPASN